jgi:hypothetical protein
MIEDNSYSREVTDKLIEIANDHNWQLAGYEDSKGPLIDFMAGDFAGYHNGPECVDCGFSFCMHCTSDIPPCPGPTRVRRGHKDES